jgi:hypothetical protein
VRDVRQRDCIRAAARADATGVTAAHHTGEFLKPSWQVLLPLCAPVVSTFILASPNPSCDARSTVVIVARKKPLSAATLSMASRFCRVTKLVVSRFPATPGPPAGLVTSGDSSACLGASSAAATTVAPNIEKAATTAILFISSPRASDEQPDQRRARRHHTGGPHTLWRQTEKAVQGQPSIAGQRPIARTCSRTVRARRRSSADCGWCNRLQLRTRSFH